MVKDVRWSNHENWLVVSKRTTFLLFISEASKTRSKLTRDIETESFFRASACSKRERSRRSLSIRQIIFLSVSMKLSNCLFWFFDKSGKVPPKKNELLNDNNNNNIVITRTRRKREIVIICAAQFLYLSSINERKKRYRSIDYYGAH